MKQRGGLFSHLGRVAGEKAVGYGLDCADMFRTFPKPVGRGWGKNKRCKGFVVAPHVFSHPADNPRQKEKAPPLWGEEELVREDPKGSEATG